MHSQDQSLLRLSSYCFWQQLLLRVPFNMCLNFFDARKSKSLKHLLPHINNEFYISVAVNAGLFEMYCVQTNLGTTQGC